MPTTNPKNASSVTVIKSHSNVATTGTESVAEGISDIEINRRDFLKIVFGTISSAALISPVWPVEAQDRPVAEPLRLALDVGGYIYDPELDWGPIPTWREWLNDQHDLNQMDKVDQYDFVRDEMQDEIYIASKGEDVDDPESACKLSDFEIELWLDEHMDVEDLSDWQVASLSPYAPGVDIFGIMEKETLARLGVGIVEGDHPGSSFVGAQFTGDLEEQNEELMRSGLNLVVTPEVA